MSAVKVVARNIPMKTALCRLQNVINVAMNCASLRKADQDKEKKPPPKRKALVLRGSVPEDAAASLMSQLWALKLKFSGSSAEAIWWKFNRGN